MKFNVNDSFIELFKIDDLFNTHIVKKISILNDIDFNILSEQVSNFVNTNNIEIMSDDREIYNLHNKFLDSNFKVYKRKFFYEKYLENHNFSYIDIFEYKSIKEIGENNFLEIFREVTIDDLERPEINFKDDYYSMCEDAGDKFDPDFWKIVYYKNKEIGIIMPQIFPDKTEEGTIFYFGLIKEYRNKGFGKILHSKCLSLLKEKNVRRYVGSTLDINYSMNKVFINNNCNKTMTRFFYKSH